MTIAEVKVFVYLLEKYGTGITITVNKTVKQKGGKFYFQDGNRLNILNSITYK